MERKFLLFINLHVSYYILSLSLMDNIKFLQLQHILHDLSV